MQHEVSSATASTSASGDGGRAGGPARRGRRATDEGVPPGDTPALPRRAHDAAGCGSRPAQESTRPAGHVVTGWAMIASDTVPACGERAGAAGWEKGGICSTSVKAQMIGSSADAARDGRVEQTPGRAGKADQPARLSDERTECASERVFRTTARAVGRSTVPVLRLVRATAGRLIGVAAPGLDRGPGLRDARRSRRRD